MSRSIELTTDKERVKTITDEPLPNSICFLLYKDTNLAGVISLMPLNHILWNPHIFIKTEFRGKGSEKWGYLVARYMRKNFGAKKFLALTPYLTAKRFAEKLGFKCIATVTKSIEEDGQILDQFLLEMG